MTEASLEDLQKLVDSYLRSHGETDIKKLLNQALSNYEGFRKAIPESDFKSSFLNYNIALGLVMKTIPSLPAFDTSGKKFKETYEAIKECIITDASYIKVKAHYHETNHITAVELNKILKEDSQDVLLIDFRPVDQFKRSHIAAENVVNIDPISVRKGHTDSDIENFSLLNSVSEQRHLFARRSEFKYVIIYDSCSLCVDFSQFHEPLTQLYNALTTRAFDKRLVSIPLVLEGGFKAWLDKFGISLCRNHHGQLSQLQPLQLSRSPSARSIISPVGQSPNHINTFNELLSNPVKTDFSKINKKLGSLNISSQPDLLKKPQPMYPTPYAHKPNVLDPSHQVAMSQPSLPLTKPMSPQILPPPAAAVPSPAPSTSNTVHVSYQLKDLHCTTGLANLGNSCYMNSIAQCLFGTTVLFSMFLNEEYKQFINPNNKLGSRGLLTNSMSKLSKQVYNSKNGVVKPIEFKSAVSVLNKNFKNFDQQDACEFLSFILDTLHEDLNEFGSYPKLKALTEEEEQRREKMPFKLVSVLEWERYLKTNFSMIVNLFQGQYASQLKCLECHATSTTFQAFTVLSLPIPETGSLDFKNLTLGDCLKDFTKLELLDDDNKWTCPHCKKKVRSSKKITITRLPKNLIIHLKRFKPNLSKITGHIKFPHQLDLSSLPPKASSPEEEELLKQFPLREQALPFQYNLYAVVNHIGSFSNGHYTSFVWKGVQEKWCQFDDSTVKKGIKTDKVVNPNAYILFYCRY
ncbi:hypothetical protein WICPIJ_001588 [Wickerhamomyces pijperi]|uniref:ubiquitinyl hydrolase 1 n=1 Tax=Wickerhamomyces pijperi TaxID=599730 RepID=A0A9P8TQZ3_WICPI|nr:hypothetical protein WICPIJ_001588 [Wickerhamomyces pijperi]